MFMGTRGVVRSYLPIVFLAVLATIAIGVSDSLGMALKILGVLVWMSVGLTVVWIFLFSDIIKQAKLERQAMKEAEEAQVQSLPESHNEGDEAL